MLSVNPYLNFPGTAEEAFTFYKSIFGGEFLAVQRFGDLPPGDKPIPDAIRNKLMHISMPIGKNILMATDAMEEMGHPVTYGTQFHLSLNTESRDENERIFNALSAGGKVTSPLADMFWGDYFGMCVDRFGVQWMVSYNANFKA